MRKLTITKIEEFLTTLKNELESKFNLEPLINEEEVALLFGFMYRRIDAVLWKCSHIPPYDLVRLLREVKDYVEQMPKNYITELAIRGMSRNDCGFENQFYVSSLFKRPITIEILNNIDNLILCEVNNFVSTLK